MGSVSLYPANSQMLPTKGNAYIIFELKIPGMKERILCVDISFAIYFSLDSHCSN